MLSEILTWLEGAPKTILVGDTIESDGRFVLHALASQILQSSSGSSLLNSSSARGGAVLWWAGGPWTPTLIAQALKKMDVSVTAEFVQQQQQQQQQSSISNDNNDNSHKKTNEARLMIRSVLDEFNQYLDDHAASNQESSSSSHNANGFMRKLLLETKMWFDSVLGHQSGTLMATPRPVWVFLDDVSTLASILGERLVYGWIISMQDLAAKREVGLIIRYSLDTDLQMLSNTGRHDRGVAVTTTAGMVTSATEDDWVGAGGISHPAKGGIWERSLVEMADLIMDVLPLESGPSREAHGRIAFTWLPGIGGSLGRHHSQPNHMACTYCLMDHKVTTCRVL